MRDTCAVRARLLVDRLSETGSTPKRRQPLTRFETCIPPSLSDHGTPVFDEHAFWQVCTGNMRGRGASSPAGYVYVSLYRVRDGTSIRKRWILLICTRVNRKPCNPAPGSRNGKSAVRPHTFTKLVGLSSTFSRLVRCDKSRVKDPVRSIRNCLSELRKFLVTIYKRER